jgi:hypothetical protein
MSYTTGRFLNLHSNTRLDRKNLPGHEHVSLFFFVAYDEEKKACNIETCWHARQILFVLKGPTRANTYDESLAYFLTLDMAATALRSYFAL